MGDTLEFSIMELEERIAPSYRFTKTTGVLTGTRRTAAMAALFPCSGDCLEHAHRRQSRLCRCCAIATRLLHAVLISSSSHVVASYCQLRNAQLAG